MRESNRSGFGDFHVKDCVALLVVVALTLSVYFSSLGAALDVRQDDHRIIFFSDSGRPLHDQILATRDESGRAMRPTVAWFLSTDAEAGRFRPLTQILEVLLPRVLGTDSFRWHLLVLLLASVSSAALFLIGRRIGGSWIEGTAMALLVVLAPDPGPAKVWYMMSVKSESFGTIFVLLAVLASMRAAQPLSRMRSEVVPLVLIAAAMLTKEPFALLLPALLVIRLGMPYFFGYASSWRATPRLKFLLIGYVSLGVLYALALGSTLAAAPVDSYGTHSLHDRGMLELGLRSTLGHVPEQAGWFAPLILAFAAIFQLRGLRASFLTLLFPIALTALWVVPQILLYSLRGGMWDHYWLPCILGFAGLNVWCLRLLRLGSPRAAFTFALVSLIAWFVNGARTNVPAVENYVQRTLMRNDAVKALAERVPRTGKVVIVTDNTVYSEYAASWLFFAGNEGRPNTTYLLYDVTRPQSAAFLKATFFPHATPLDQLSSCDIDAIVFLDRPADADISWSRWYQSACFNIKPFVRPQQYISMRKLGLVRDTVRLDVAFNKRLR